MVARLIYADWLSENGQEDRAEFIRAQIEHPHKAILARDTFYRMDKSWLHIGGDIPTGSPEVSSGIFKYVDDTSLPGCCYWLLNGFPGQASTFPPWWIRHGREVVKRFPITSVTLFNVVGKNRLKDTYELAFANVPVEFHAIMRKEIDLDAGLGYVFNEPEDAFSFLSHAALRWARL